jgi:hypothetical protein
MFVIVTVSGAENPQAPIGWSGEVPRHPSLYQDAVKDGDMAATKKKCDDKRINRLKCFACTSRCTAVAITSLFGGPRSKELCKV